MAREHGSEPAEQKKLGLKISDDFTNMLDFRWCREKRAD